MCFSSVLAKIYMLVFTIHSFFLDWIVNREIYEEDRGNPRSERKGIKTVASNKMRVVETIKLILDFRLPFMSKYLIWNRFFYYSNWLFVFEKKRSNAKYFQKRLVEAPRCKTWLNMKVLEVMPQKLICSRLAKSRKYKKKIQVPRSLFYESRGF